MLIIKDSKPKAKRVFVFYALNVTNPTDYKFLVVIEDTGSYLIDNKSALLTALRVKDLPPAGCLPVRVVWPEQFSEVDNRLKALDSFKEFRKTRAEVDVENGKLILPEFEVEIPLPKPDMVKDTPIESFDIAVAFDKNNNAYVPSIYPPSSSL